MNERIETLLNDLMDEMAKELRGLERRNDELEKRLLIAEEKQRLIDDCPPTPRRKPCCVRGCLCTVIE